ncbi:MAG: TM0106 family RecB-like putative nuclease [Thermodesulfovibrionales bacterium]|jgi:predicted RecB family nuclease
MVHKGIESAPPGAFEQVLFNLGKIHEKSHLSTFPEFSDLTNKPYEKTLEEIRKDSPVIYQGELKHLIQIDGHLIEIVGIPDLIIKEGANHIIRDCKIARHVTEDKHPEIPRQLQIYGWLFEKFIGKRPLRLEVFKGDGNIEPIDYMGEATVHSYMQELLEVIALPEEPYSPVGWTKCGGCGYNDLCMKRANELQSVALLTDVDQGLAVRLKELGVLTIKDLAAKYDETSLSELKKPHGAKEQRVGKRAKGILLQAKAMLENKEIVVRKPAIPPSKNYVMFDLEGLPPQLDELDKIYLWGMQVLGEKPSGFVYSLAEMGTDGDGKGWDNFLKIAEQIFADYGDIPFVHWANYEKTKINTYIKRYGDIDGIAERVLANLVDLLPITKDAVILPRPSYSLKVVEQHVGFKRTQEEYGGDWSIAKYIEAVETEDEKERQSIMDEIIKYNEEDLQATWAVFEWLKGLR